MVTSGVCCLTTVHTPEEALPPMTTDQPHISPESSGQAPAAGADSENPRVTIPGARPSDQSPSGTEWPWVIITRSAGQ